jgi:hypothetical protein
MRCFCLKSNFLRLCASLEVEDRPEEEERSRLPKSIAWKIGKRSTSAGTGNRGSPAREVTAEARADELLGGTEQFG